MVKLGMEEAGGVMAVHTLAHTPGVAGFEASPLPPCRPKIQGQKEPEQGACWQNHGACGWVHSPEGHQTRSYWGAGQYT